MRPGGLRGTISLGGRVGASDLRDATLSDAPEGRISDDEEFRLPRPRMPTISRYEDAVKAQEARPNFHGEVCDGAS